MQLLSLASAFPEHQYTQLECLAMMRNAHFWNQLTHRSQRILDKIFSADTGIRKRHFCLPELDRVWSFTASELNHYYEENAPVIASNALEKSLKQAGMEASDIDVLLVSSCTGYLCPGVSSYIAERMGCRSNIHTQDLTGHGCGAAIPLLQIADAYTHAMPDAIVACLSVEICSAAFYVSDDPDVLISMCLFGDGAAASLWSSTGGSYQTGEFQSLHLPKEREKVRFVHAEGKLKNQLHQSVPTLTASAAKQLYSKVSQPSKIITHGGGRDVILALEQALPMTSLQASGMLSETKEVLRDYGNLSSPSVMVALEKHLHSSTPVDTIWLASFGAGFSAHSVELTKTH